MSDAPIPGDVKRLLIVGPSWVGDTVMATPVFRAARRLRPEARIVALLRRGLEDLLDGAGWIDEVVTVPGRGLLGPLAAARSLRRHRPDAALLLPNSFRAALTVHLARIPIVIGYDRDSRRFLLTCPVPVERRDGPTPTVEYYRRLAEVALGEGALPGELELAVTDGQRAEANRLLNGVARPFAVLNPGANRPAKRWPADRFAAVADELASRHGLSVVLTGSPAEEAVLAEVARLAGPATPIVDLARRGLTLGTLKAVVAEAALLITNDTGPRHIGAALGTPVISLFGPTDHRWTTLDCPHERILLAEPFLPVDQVADRHPKLCAIERIPVQDVLAATAELLGAPADPAASTR